MEGKKVGLVVLMLVVLMFMSSSVQLASAIENMGIQLVSDDGNQVQVVEYLKGGPRKILKGKATNGCAGRSCNILNDPCDSGCFCLPVGILVGVCVGG